MQRKDGRRPSNGARATETVNFIFLGTDLLKVKTGNADGAARDRSFSFIVTGEG